MIRSFDLASWQSQSKVGQKDTQRQRQSIRIKTIKSDIIKVKAKAPAVPWIGNPNFGPRSKQNAAIESSQTKGCSSSNYKLGNACSEVGGQKDAKITNHN